MTEYIEGVAAWIVVFTVAGAIIGIAWSEIETWIKKRRERRNPPAPKIAGQYLRFEDRYFCVHGRPTYHSDAQPTHRCYAPEPEPADEQEQPELRQAA